MTLRHGSSHKCLAINMQKDKLLMESCDSDDERQRWKFGQWNEEKAKEALLKNAADVLWKEMQEKKFGAALKRGAKRISW